MVAIRVWEVEVVVVVVEDEGSSSERVEGERRATWPKRRPSRGPEEEEKRWIREARVGPEIAILSMGGSAIALCERESERAIKKASDFDSNSTTCSFSRWWKVFLIIINLSHFNTNNININLFSWFSIL
jgi:hypothetical protein